MFVSVQIRLKRCLVVGIRLSYIQQWIYLLFPDVTCCVFVSGGHSLKKCEQVKTLMNEYILYINNKRNANADTELL